MARIVNTVKVQTAQGEVEVTKTSTHRTYVLASVVQFVDGTQSVLSWHLTEAAAAKFARSNVATMLAQYADRKRETEGATVALLPVVVRDSKSTKVPTVEDVVTDESQEEEAPESEVVRAAKGQNVQTGCLCRCGRTAAAGKHYLPGHDARHASQVARLVSQGRTESWPADQVNSLVELLPTNALKLKALAQAHRLDEKAAAKQAKQAK